MRPALRAYPSQRRRPPKRGGLWRAVRSFLGLHGGAGRGAGGAVAEYRPSLGRPTAPNELPVAARAGLAFAHRFPNGNSCPGKTGGEIGATQAKTGRASYFGGAFAWRKRGGNRAFLGGTGPSGRNRRYCRFGPDQPKPPAPGSRNLYRPGQGRGDRSVGPGPGRGYGHF